MKHILFGITILIILSTAAISGDIPTAREYTNSIGMKMVRLEPGTFQMGQLTLPLPPQVLVEPQSPAGSYDFLSEGDYDERPIHKVKITQPFYMGICEVTNYQYELFNPEHESQRGRNGISKEDDEAVIYVNWYDAQAFCRWLSDKESLPYRLATEAEWEYACRAGTTTNYNTGETLPAELLKNAKRTEGAPKVSLHVGKTVPNGWGLYDMHGNVEEWCYDWYGPYQNSLQSDPVGRISGDFRVTRGGSAGTKPFYLRTANRMGMLPEDKHWLTGFRVVLGRFPETKPLPSPAVEGYQKNVIIREASEIAKGSDPDKPWFKGPRKYVTIPKEATGPLYAGHNHDPAIVECPNGDLLTVWYTCFSEKDRELNQAVSRLRWGSEQWEPASLFWDAPDRNDHAPALWFDGDRTIYHFLSVSAGPTYHDGALTMRTSKDSGACWSRARFIVSEHTGLMPSEPVFRMNDGAIALTVDGSKTLWVSRDEGLSWENLAGDMPGIHVGATQLANGQIVGFTRGGSVNGKMSKSVSVDGGKTYTNTASEFPPIGGGQRLVLLRLREGALFFASFATKPVYVINSSGQEHKIRGFFAAVSLDGGQSWPYKRLISDNGKPRMIECTDGRVVTMSDYTGEFEGYLSVCQSQNGLIHLISSREHYAFNLKWMMTRPPVPESPLRIRRFVENFTGPRKLEVRGWADYKGYRGSFNGSGQYTVDATPHGGVNRIVGEGSFDAQFIVGNIRSNSGLAPPRVNVGFRDAFRETFYVEVKPDLIGVVLPESMPEVKAVSFPENISSVKVRFTWDEYDNRLRVFYGINNAEPQVEFDESKAGLYIDRGMSESTSAFMYVRNGIADLDHFEIVPIKY